MNELFETFTIFELLAIGCAAIGILIPCAYIGWRFVYHMWCIVDDAKVEEGENWHEMTWITWGCCFFLWIGLSIGVVLFRHVIVHIPIDVYLWIGAFVGSIYGLRYLRRLHKAIHGHIKNPEAHTTEEDETEYMKKLEEEERMYRALHDGISPEYFHNLREEHFHDQFR